MLDELQDSSYLFITCSLKIYIIHLYVPVDCIFLQVVVKYAYTNVSFAFFLLIVL